jgi:putative transposase
MILGIQQDLKSEDIKVTISQLCRWFEVPKPEVIRCDNGPEYISAAIQAWAQDWGIRLEYIQLGKPQQNAYVERFNRTVRYEWLS